MKVLISSSKQKQTENWMHTGKRPITASRFWQFLLKCNLPNLNSQYIITLLSKCHVTKSVEPSKTREEIGVTNLRQKKVAK